MARSRSGSESSFDDSFFLKTYIPLSNLPTPPLSYTRNHTRQQSLEFVLPGEDLDHELLGPAVVLTSRIPSSTSLTPASVPLVQSILARANLPLETIALAVCILDSLNGRFALAFRHGCPLSPTATSSTASYFDVNQAQHIDSIHPELLILSALILAVKFLDDEQQFTSHYALDWGKGIWTCAQINYTQLSILQNIGYKILPLWVEELISVTLIEMQRAGQQYEPLVYDEEIDIMLEKKNLIVFEGERPMSNGKAIFGSHDQMTPAETPSIDQFTELTNLSLETKKAFSGAVEMEPIPVYVDPGIE